MNIELVNKYWPLALFATWMFYKWWSSYKIVKRLPSLQNDGAIFIDVRSGSEFENAHANICKNIPFNEIKTSLDEIPNGVPIVLCCATGSRSLIAKISLIKNGYKDVHNIGKWTLLRNVQSVG
jgi:rhodanese-related sulfurtransferase